VRLCVIRSAKLIAAIAAAAASASPPPAPAGFAMVRRYGCGFRLGTFFLDQAEIFQIVLFFKRRR
jgi:hypothetical protein